MKDALRIIGIICYMPVLWVLLGVGYLFGIIFSPIIIGFEIGFEKGMDKMEDFLR